MHRKKQDTKAEGTPAPIDPICMFGMPYSEHAHPHECYFPDLHDKALATPEAVQMSGQMYLSECGGYVCRVAQSESVGEFEAWKADGSIHWKCDQRIKTWEDAKRRRHPLPYSVGGYSAQKAGQKPGSFTLNLLHCDVRKYVKPYTGNTIIDSLHVVFRRKIQRNHMQSWAVCLKLEPSK